MGILSRDDFFAAIDARVGTDSSPESIQFLEDMTDTYNALEGRANGDGIDWEQKYNELDNSWRERYRHRFYDGGGSQVPPMLNDELDNANSYDPESVTVDDLFN